MLLIRHFGDDVSLPPLSILINIKLEHSTEQLQRRHCPTVDLHDNLPADRHILQYNVKHAIRLVDSSRAGSSCSCSNSQRHFNN